MNLLWRGAARRGWAWLGAAGRGGARLGKATTRATGGNSGAIYFGMARQGRARRGPAWQGVARNGNYETHGR